MKRINIKTRRKEREIALWKLFEQEFDDGSHVGIEEFLQDAPEDDVFAKLEIEQTEFTDYPDVVLDAFRENKDQIDSLIASHLKSSWTMEKIPKPEKNILRLALTEMYFVPEPIGKEIAINEAVDLSKRYGEDDAGRYINGILNRISEEKPQSGVRQRRSKKKNEAKASSPKDA